MRASSSGPVLCTTGRRSGRWACPHPHPQPGTRRHRPEDIPPCGSARRSGGSRRRTDRERAARGAYPGPDRRHPESFALGVGAEPGGTIARGAESLGGCEELVQGHRLAEGESLGEHPLSRFDLAGERGVWLGPGEIEGRVIPRIRWFLRYLRLEQWQGLCLLPLGDGEESRIRFGLSVHQEIGDQVRVVAGVVGKDAGRQGRSVSGRFLSRKTVASGAVRLVRTGRRASTHALR